MEILKYKSYNKYNRKELKDKIGSLNNIKTIIQETEKMIM